MAHPVLNLTDEQQAAIFARRRLDCALGRRRLRQNLRAYGTFPVVPGAAIRIRRPGIEPGPNGGHHVHRPRGP